MSEPGAAPRDGTCLTADKCPADKDSVWVSTAQCGSDERCCVQPFPCETKINTPGWCVDEDRCTTSTQAASQGARGCQMFPRVSFKCCIGAGACVHVCVRSETLVGCGRRGWTDDSRRSGVDSRWSTACTLAALVDLLLWATKVSSAVRMVPVEYRRLIIIIPASPTDCADVLCASSPRFPACPARQGWHPEPSSAERCWLATTHKPLSGVDYTAPPDGNAASDSRLCVRERNERTLRTTRLEHRGVRCEGFFMADGDLEGNVSLSSPECPTVARTPFAFVRTCPYK